MSFSMSGPGILVVRKTLYSPEGSKMRSPYQCARDGAPAEINEGTTSILRAVPTVRDILLNEV